MSDSTATLPKPQEISCEQVRELLSEYVDRELSAQERANVQNHLTLCVKCGTESSRMVGLKEFVQHWDGLKGTSSFHQKVMQEYISESRMMASKPFTDAADKARVDSQRQEQESGEKKPPDKGSLLTLAVVVLALAAVVVFFFLLLTRK